MLQMRDPGSLRVIPDIYGDLHANENAGGMA
jgi:hypothetical protein